MANKHKQKTAWEKEIELLERDVPDGTHLYTKEELEEIERVCKEAEVDIIAGKGTLLSSKEELDEFFRKLENDEI